MRRETTPGGGVPSERRKTSWAVPLRSSHSRARKTCVPMPFMGHEASPREQMARPGHYPDWVTAVESFFHGRSSVERESNGLSGMWADFALDPAWGRPLLARNPFLRSGRDATRRDASKEISEHFFPKY